MPVPPTPAAHTTGGHRQPGRRAVLGLLAPLAGAAALTGCGVRWVSGTEPTPAPSRGPDDVAREVAAADARALLTLALPLTTAGAAPGPAAVQQSATAVVDACTAHLRALGADTAPGTATPAAGAAAGVDALAGELAAAAGRALDAVPGDVGGGMARLLCAVGASRALLLDGVTTAAGTATPAVDLPAVPAPAPPPATTRGAVPSTAGGTDGEDTDGEDTDGEDTRAVAALQAVLAGEHAAVWCFGLVAARLEGGPRDRALAALAAHRVARDDVTALLRARGAQPVGAHASYDAAAPAPEAAILLAASVEERLAAVHADLAAASRADRALAAVGVVRSARAARGWGGTTTNLPGLPGVGEDGLPLPLAAPPTTADAAPAAGAATSPPVSG
ncbi:ferritin-like domain-containing protein [Paenibacillus sp. TRM 82003]|uniref:DUF4439 domain-containing protein n=1 Tax=Kineococcus sp. TRM81007 TaxID=2925831 RepID=UPI001F56092C|nr:DUF4439 domain-containing protein [Kineococcus sp. TRM81007]MCI2240259.1 ferritin-like domain-containing protein [Kineococcus sp. TRM81007]MCI3927564.1 ferritin-like domain-containing protein [Paenibacillus sp. TRM 82003]